MPARTPRPSSDCGSGGRARHEQRQQREGAEERGGVDVEHDRRAEHGDQEARGGGPEQRRGAIRPLDDGIRLRDDVLVVADQLGQDQALGGEVRREEDPDHGDDREEQREGQPAERVEQRGSTRAAARGSSPRRSSCAARRSARSRRRTGCRGSRSAGARTRGRRPSASAEPVVVRTNHGSARNVICDPRDEMTSAETSATIGRWRSGLFVRSATRRPAGRPRRRARSACPACAGP